jgi:photoactive yellow protein
MMFWKNLFARLFSNFASIQFDDNGNVKGSSGSSSASEVNNTKMQVMDRKEAAQAPTFVPKELFTQLPKLRQSDIDKLPYGCVKVDDEGNIVLYNQYEADLASIDKSEALGKNFFRQIAPCTNNRLVFGRFKDGVNNNGLDVVVSYAFTYRMKPTLVDVHMYRHAESKTNWVFVKKAA